MSIIRKGVFLFYRIDPSFENFYREQIFLQDINTVPPPELHVTIQYIGDVLMQPFESVLLQLAFDQLKSEHPYFCVRPKGLQLFDGGNVVLEVENFELTLAQIKTADLLAPTFVPDIERPFRAHITLVKNQTEIPAWLSKIKFPPAIIINNPSLTYKDDKISENIIYSLFPS